MIILGKYDKVHQDFNVIITGTGNISKSRPDKKAGQKKAADFSQPTKVALFCGGRGCASLIRELVRTPYLQISLIVNGYDDGLSTGHLRDLTPNMLGPSDFRKNLSRMIDLYSSEQYALQRLLEMRFPESYSSVDIKAFEDYVANPRSSNRIPPPLDGVMNELDAEIRKLVIEHLQILFEYQHENKQSLNYKDCSLGNLVFAGAYLKANSNFNASVDNLTSMFHAPVQLINATKGENRILAAIKADGTILYRESDIVGKQSAEPIEEFFLLNNPLSSDQKNELVNSSKAEKLKLLRFLEAPVSISPEADAAIREADIIIYGPGTQFSSLLPSYKTVGMKEAIELSQAKLKVFICNIAEDNDIQGITCSQLVDKALAVIGDGDNSRKSITHIFCHDGGNARTARSLALGQADQAEYAHAPVIKDVFESQGSPGTHSGHAVVRRIVDLYDRASKKEQLAVVRNLCRFTRSSQGSRSASRRVFGLKLVGTI